MNVIMSISPNFAEFNNILMSTTTNQSAVFSMSSIDKDF